MKVQLFSNHSAWLVGALFALACSTACAPPIERIETIDSLAEPTSSGSAREATVAPVSEDTATYIGIEGLAAADASQCVVSEPLATFEGAAVDIIIVLDNSDSMANEIEAVENNINVHFGNILGASELDYRVILLSEHRVGRRREETASICVTTPLSGVENCDNASAPIFTDQFFQYGVASRGTNALEVLLDTYQPPFLDPGVEDSHGQAPMGWSQWTREGARKVVLVLSDDDDTFPTREFLRLFTALAPQDLGTERTPLFAFHSITGLKPKANWTEAYLPNEPVQQDLCGPSVGLDRLVTNAGESFQELSRRTGGLRFPLCESNGYDVVFQAIADKVVQDNAIACTFSVPNAPVGRVLDLETLQVRLLAPAGDLSLTQVLSSETCRTNSFYVDGSTVQICPNTCIAVRALPDAQLQVVLGCESSLLL